MGDSFDKKSITNDLAFRMVQAAESKAREINVLIVTAIVDEGGNLKSFSRMDGAPQIAIDIAINKAWTSVSFGIPTHEWFNFIKDDPPLLHGIVHTPRLTVYGGGYPIKKEDYIIGGIGVSGGHYSQDQECAEAALKLLGKEG